MAIASYIVSVVIIAILITTNAPWYYVIAIAILSVGLSIAEAILYASKKISESINDGIRKIKEAIKDK